MSTKSDSTLQLSRSIYLTFWADQSQNTGCPTGKYLRAITSEQTFLKLSFTSQEKTNTTSSLIDICIWLIDAKSQRAPFKHLEPGGGERLSRDSYHKSPAPSSTSSCSCCGKGQVWVRQLRISPSGRFRAPAGCFLCEPSQLLSLVSKGHRFLLRCFSAQIYLHKMNVL